LVVERWEEETKREKGAPDPVVIASWDATRDFGRKITYLKGKASWEKN